MKKSSLYFLILSCTGLQAQVVVEQINGSCTHIKVPSKFVKPTITRSIEGESLCSIEVKTPNVYFDFFVRRALSRERCLDIVQKTQAILKKNKRVEILGRQGHKEKKGVYSSSWEMIRGLEDRKCEAYFDIDCKRVFEVYPEFKSRLGIDSKVYP